MYRMFATVCAAAVIAVASGAASASSFVTETFDLRPDQVVINDGFDPRGLQQFSLTRGSLTATFTANSTVSSATSVFNSGSGVTGLGIRTTKDTQSLGDNSNLIDNLNDSNYEYMGVSFTGFPASELNQISFPGGFVGLEAGETAEVEVNGTTFDIDGPTSSFSFNPAALIDGSEELTIRLKAGSVRDAGGEAGFQVRALQATGVPSPAAVGPGLALLGTIMLRRRRRSHV